MICFRTLLAYQESVSVGELTDFDDEQGMPPGGHFWNL